MDTEIQTDQELNNNEVKQCDEADGWCTVAKKKTHQKKKSRRWLEESISILPPICENVSEDEVYFSSSAECSDDDNNSLDSEIAHPKRNTNARILNLNNNNKAAIDTKQNPSLSELNQKNARLNAKDGQTAACCFAKKLDSLTDKEMFTRRSGPKLKLTSGVTSQSGDGHNDGCGHCSYYQNTVGGFVKYFKTRNSIEKPLPGLKKLDQELINNANKFRIGAPAFNQSWKSVSPTPSHENILPSGSPPKLTLDKSLPSFRPKTGPSKFVESSSQNLNSEATDTATESKLVPETTDGAKETKPKPETVQNNFLNVKCSRMEKSLQETKLKLQNLYDNLESLKLDSTIYFSKLIEHLDS